MQGGPTTGVALRRIRPERNERRFYRMDVATDLFGTAVLMRNWGRIGTHGRLRSDPYPDEAAARAALLALAAAKRRRGYRDWPPPLPLAGRLN